MQQVIDGEIQEFKEQKEVESTIQRECKVRFTLAHSAPIMKTLLGDQLRYLLTKKLPEKSSQAQTIYQRKWIQQPSSY